MRLEKYLNEAMSKKQLAMIAGISDRQDKKAKKFKVGDTVTHWKHGKAKIVGVHAKGRGVTFLNVDFDGTTMQLPSHEFKEGQ